MDFDITFLHFYIAIFNGKKKTQLLIQKVLIIKSSNVKQFENGWIYGYFASSS